MELPEALFRIWKEDSIQVGPWEDIEYNGKIPRVSCYFPRGLSILVPLIPATNYILSPIYAAGVDDVQIGVTGKVKRGESPIAAIKREIAEETGLYLAHEQVPFYHHDITTSYLIPFGYTRAIPYTYKYSESEDRKDKRVAALIFASLDQLRDYLGKKDHIKLIEDDPVVGMAAIRADVVASLTKSIPTLDCPQKIKKHYAPVPTTEKASNIVYSQYLNKRAKQFNMWEDNWNYALTLATNLGYFNNIYTWQEFLCSPLVNHIYDNLRKNINAKLKAQVEKITGINANVLINRKCNDIRYVAPTLRLLQTIKELPNIYTIEYPSDLIYNLL